MLDEKQKLRLIRAGLSAAEQMIATVLNHHRDLSEIMLNKSRDEKYLQRVLERLAEMGVIKSAQIGTIMKDF